MALSSGQLEEGKKMGHRVKAALPQLVKHYICTPGCAFTKTRP
jgi:hypothetical protein